MQKSLKNAFLEIVFDLEQSRLVEFTNRLTGETCRMEGDGFELEGEGFHLIQGQMTRFHQEMDAEVYRIRCHSDGMQVSVEYRLAAAHAFVEKRMVLIPEQDCSLKRVVLSQPVFSANSLELVCYRHPNFALIEGQVAIDIPHESLRRPPNSEPSSTFFGRMQRGGFMLGVEVPFDSSTITGSQVVLAINPNLKLKAGERFTLEPLYLGVYQLGKDDLRAQDWQPDLGLYIGHGNVHQDTESIEKFKQSIQDTLPEVNPLPSESRAMVSLTSAVLGRRRNEQLVAAVCGWHSEMEQWEYTEESAEADCRAMDVLADCGVDWWTDSHPWGGETQKMNALRETDHYELGPLVKKVLSHAKQKGLRVVQWPSMNNTHPWSQGEGRTFLAHKENWLRLPAPQWRDIECASMWDCWPNRFQAYRSHCIANQPFWEWITDLNLQAYQNGLYDGWVMDGDFWGTGAFFQSTIPVECYAENHDHLPGDANYACQRALDQWVTKMLSRYPDLLITMCRPAMDLGVWAQRNVDACFTLVETGTSKSNLSGGNEIRMASRMRVHQHFFPHWIDWSLLFPSFANPNTAQNTWSGDHLDYILLSALSCSPNLLMYIPARSGIPPADRLELRKWLDWGRQNSPYLFVRKDLFDWPAPGKVDGSAHIIDDQGILFLFNPNREALEISFELSQEAIGLNATPGRNYVIQEEYPGNNRRLSTGYGETVRWDVPGETPVVLRLSHT